MGKFLSPYLDLQFRLKCTSHEYVKLKVISTRRDTDSDIIELTVELDLSEVPE